MFMEGTAPFYKGGGAVHREGGAGQGGAKTSLPATVNHRHDQPPPPLPTVSQRLPGAGRGGFMEGAAPLYGGGCAEYEHGGAVNGGVGAFTEKRVKNTKVPNRFRLHGTTAESEGPGSRFGGECRRGFGI